MYPLGTFYPLLPGSWDQNLRVPFCVPLPLPGDTLAVINGHKRVVKLLMRKVAKSLDKCPTCIVCMDRPTEVVLVPCGHQIACGPCVHQWNEEHKGCPMDRIEILKILPLGKASSTQGSRPASSEYSEEREHSGESESDIDDSESDSDNSESDSDDYESLANLFDNAANDTNYTMTSLYVDVLAPGS